ncbi:MAG TPA: hypothetical protein VMG12_44700 [Polyangiaceae bacterium]|nr:hypothetical protein [Polyangiaceae bacterium]
MIPPILHGLLWLARAALRAGRLPVQAAHGYADPAYRPPRLPFVSIVGPLAVAQDRGRDATKPREAMFQLPGHLLGSMRPTPASVPAGTLSLRFDGDASVTVSVAGGNLQPDSAARQVATQIEAALHAAVAAGEYRNTDGSAVIDPARRAELALSTCRWDAVGRRFAISSGRRGTAEGVRRSSVELIGAAPGATAGALGFSDAVSVDGRLKRHKLPAPRAMTVDVRLELWAASQGELAAMTDDLARLAEARTSFATRPALLAADANAGDTTLRLLPEGEPLTPASLVLLEAADGPNERVSNRAFAAPPGALLAGPPRFRLSGASTLGFDVNPTPLIPSPLDRDHPAPRGIALSLGVSIPGASAGQVFRLASLQHGADAVLVVDVEFSSSGGQLFADVISRAAFSSGGVSNQAETRQRIVASSPASSERPFERGTVIHVAVVVSTGHIESWVDGEARAVDAQPAPVVGQGGLLGGSDMRLSIGGGAGNPLPIDVRHAHLFSEPIGAFDVRLRSSLAAVRHFVPGTRLRLARTEDGYAPGQERAETTVVSVDGDTLTIFPAVEDTWPRGRTLLFADELFLQQIELRRRDDLLNQLYRLSVDYRIAALLESDFPEASAPLVELPVVDVRTLSAARAAQGVPSVKVVA